MILIDFSFLLFFELIPLFYLTSSFLLPFCFGPPSELIRSIFGKNPKKARTNPEATRSEKGRRVVLEYNMYHLKQLIPPNFIAVLN